MTKSEEGVNVCGCEQPWPSGVTQRFGNMNGNVAHVKTFRRHVELEKVRNLMLKIGRIYVPTWIGPE